MLKYQNYVNLRYRKCSADMTALLIKDHEHMSRLRKFTIALNMLV